MRGIEKLDSLLLKLQEETERHSLSRIVQVWAVLLALDH